MVNVFKNKSLKINLWNPMIKKYILKQKWTNQIIWLFNIYIYFDRNWVKIIKFCN